MCDTFVFIEAATQRCLPTAGKSWVRFLTRGAKVLSVWSLNPFFTAISCGIMTFSDSDSDSSHSPGACQVIRHAKLPLDVSSYMSMFVCVSALWWIGDQFKMFLLGSPFDSQHPYKPG